MIKECLILLEPCNFEQVRVICLLVDFFFYSVLWQFMQCHYCRCCNDLWPKGGSIVRIADRLFTWYLL